ncbi:MAG: flippase [Actinobacteria bacterium]|nr:flippase [Actinomycetota bacterium]MCG2807481.1 flippase [Coriobacteriia bacterium]
MGIVRKATTLAFGEGLARVFGVVVYVFIARVLGVAGFGIFSFAMGTALLAGVMIDMGQSSHLGRTIPGGGLEHTHLYARMTFNKLLSGVVITAVAFLVMKLAGVDATTVYVTLLMFGWVTLLQIVEGMRAVMRALGWMAADSIINALESAGRLLAVLFAAWLGAGVVGFGVAFLAEAAVAGIVGFAVVSRRVRLIPTAEEWAANASFAREAAALGLVAIASAGFYRLDQVFVLPLAGESASGLYGAAARVVFTATVSSMLITQAAYPGLAAASDNVEEYRAQLRRALGLAVIAATAITVVLVVFAEPIVLLLFGEAYREAIGLMRVLSGVVLFNAVTVVSMYSASSMHRERRVLPRIVGLAIATVIANVVLIPMYGALACAWISVIGEVALAGSLLWLSRDRLGRTLATKGE